MLRLKYFFSCRYFFFKFSSSFSALATESFCFLTASSCNLTSCFKESIFACFSGETAGVAGSQLWIAYNAINTKLSNVIFFMYFNFLINTNFSTNK
jgi:hypothetical protein